MVLKQSFPVHIYYNLHETDKILFNCIYPLYKNILEKEKFEFIYLSDRIRGEHFKFFFKFQYPISADYFRKNYLEQIQAFIDNNKSAQPNLSEKSFLIDFPNNSLQEFKEIPRLQFIENPDINDKLIDFMAAYTPSVMELRIDYDEDAILTAGLILSNAIISAFPTPISEKADYFTWVFKQKLPSADYYSRKDKDIRKAKQKENKELLEKLRRNYLEQKDFVRNLIDHFTNANDEDIDLLWLPKFKEDLNGLIELLNQNGYPVPENFKYQSNVSTAIVNQEKWPIIDYIIAYFYNVLGCSDLLSYNIVYFMQEHYKNEQKNLVNIN